MSQKQQALYYSGGKNPVALAVAEKNDDGTVNLANAAGEVVVTGCRVTEQPEPGCACLKSAPAESPAPKPGATPQKGKGGR